ncbi:MAG: PQQ-binding-like beta-propeller repeat protein [Rhizomicrobium sp.]
MGIRTIAATAVCALCAATQVLAASAFAPKDQKEDAVTLQINPAHSGEVSFSEGFAPPLVKLWSQDTGGDASYALVAEGKVFTVASGNDVFAFDLATGNKDWEHLVSDGTLGGAYDDGQLFFIDFDGLMTALKSKSGKVAWSAQMPDQYAFSSPPIALKGQVFTGGAGEGGTLYGVDEKTGHVNWTQSVENGDDSSPAYGDGGLYVSYPCQYYKFALNGHPDWHYSGDCEGGGGSTPSYFKNRVYINDWASGNFVLDTKTGQIVGTYSGGQLPAFFTLNKKGYGLTLTNSKLYCFDTKTGNVAWSFSASGLTGYPIVVNGQPVIGSSSGSVYMLDGATGSQIWTASVGAGISSLSAGEGKLVVVSGSVVTVYAPQ